MKVKVDPIFIGQKMTFAEVGEVLVPNNAIVEVPEEVGKGLVENLGYEDVDGVITSDSKGVVVTEFEEVIEDEINQAMSFSSMKKTELVELAKKAELPEEEWESLNKTKLVKYLTNKI